jgi:hypothetical protein
MTSDEAFLGLADAYTEHNLDTFINSLVQDTAALLIIRQRCLPGTMDVWRERRQRVTHKPAAKNEAATVDLPRQAFPTRARRAGVSHSEA